MIYIALLRGINVGGNNKIEMKQLKKTFEKAGMQEVQTYINTGNIIFSQADVSKAELESTLEQAISEDFGLRIKVLVLDLHTVRRIIETIPEAWTNDQHMKSDVMFLWENIDEASILDQLAIKPEIDTVIYVPGALLWSVEKENTTRSGMMKLAGSKLYKQMTIRNVNTSRKIYELMIHHPSA